MNACCKSYQPENMKTGDKFALGLVLLKLRLRIPTSGENPAICAKRYNEFPVIFG
jgi:hypothetical protein